MPVTQHSLMHEQSISPPATPTSNANGERQKIKPADVCVGSILWLPPHTPSNSPLFCSYSSCAGEAMQTLAYNHPVVVLKIRQQEGSIKLGDLICTVALLTTFKDTSLPDYERKRPRSPYHQGSLPISQVKNNESRPPLTTTGITYLHLEKRELKLQSYVRFDHIWEIPLTNLFPYRFREYCRAYHYRLRQESYEEVMNRIGLPVEPFEHTNRLHETSKKRLAALARTQVLVATAVRVVEQRSVQVFPTTTQDRLRFPSYSDVSSYGAVGPTVTMRTAPRVIRGDELPYYSDGSLPGDDPGSFGWGKFTVVVVGVLFGASLLIGWCIG